MDKRLVIAKKHYPYEMYCKTCSTVVAYCVFKGEIGSIITTSGIIKLDGTFPIPGDIIECKCPRFSGLKCFLQRLRK